MSRNRIPSFVVALSLASYPVIAADAAAPVTPQQFGAKCDGTTDDSTAFQAAEDAAAKSGFAVAYSGQCSFSRTINLGLGVVHRGSGISGTVLTYTGKDWAFSLMTPLAFPCDVKPAPSFFDFTLKAPKGSGIRLNSPSVAGFQDTCTATAKGQSVLTNGRMENLLLPDGARGTIGVQFAKVFNYAIRDVTITFFGTQFDLEGSDNIDFQHNNLSYALEQGLLAAGHGTLGNELHVHNNSFNTIYTNANYFINSSYNQIIINDNYFETQFGGGKAAINLSAGLNDTIINNGMYIVPSLVPHWLQVSARLETLTLRNNWSGGAAITANFGDGAYYIYNEGGTPQFIYGDANPAGNGGIPFFTDDMSGASHSPPAAPGVTLARVSPSSPNGAYGPYALKLRVKSGCFVLQPAGGAAGQVNFSVRPVVSDTVDVWLNGYAAAPRSQRVGVSVNGGASQVTLSGKQAWYKVFSGISVSDPVLTLANTDMSGAANVCSVVFVKH